MADEKKATHAKQPRKLSAQEKKLIAYRITVLLLVIVLIVVVILWVRNYLVTSNAQEQYTHLQQEVNTIDFYPVNETETESQTEEEEQTDAILSALGIDVPDKKLDWESLKQTNPDIYAWIYIPDTNIDYPILQHDTNDTYYLNHNLDGSKGYPGCIFTQMLNSKDFTDYNTVIYGHNMKDGSMFRTLHEFEDESFFMSHPYIYIYTEENVLVYEVFSAYTSDNSHILNTNDCSSEEGFAAYLQKVYQQARLNGWYRAGVPQENRVVTLSTCTGGNNSSSKRFLVQAVLMNGDTAELTQEEEQEVPEIYDPFTGFDDEDADTSEQGLHKTTGEDLEKLEGKTPLDATGKQ